MSPQPRLRLAAALAASTSDDLRWQMRRHLTTRVLRNVCNFARVPSSSSASPTRGACIGDVLAVLALRGRLEGKARRVRSRANSLAPSGSRDHRCRGRDHRHLSPNLQRPRGDARVEKAIAALARQLPFGVLRWGRARRPRRLPRARLRTLSTFSASCALRRAVLGVTFNGLGPSGLVAAAMEAFTMASPSSSSLSLLLSPLRDARLPEGSINEVFVAPRTRVDHHECTTFSPCTSSTRPCRPRARARSAACFWSFRKS